MEEGGWSGSPGSGWGTRSCFPAPPLGRRCLASLPQSVDDLAHQVGALPRVGREQAQLRCNERPLLVVHFTRVAFPVVHLPEYNLPRWRFMTASRSCRPPRQARRHYLEAPPDSSVSAGRLPWMDRFPIFGDPASADAKPGPGTNCWTRGAIS